MTTAQNEIFVGTKHQNCYVVGRGKNIMGESLLVLKFFLVGEEFANFWLVGGGSLSSC